MGWGEKKKITHGAFFCAFVRGFGDGATALRCAINLIADNTVVKRYKSVEDHTGVKRHQAARTTFTQPMDGAGKKRYYR